MKSRYLLIFSLLLSGMASSANLLELYQQALKADPEWLAAQSTEKASAEAYPQALSYLLPNATVTSTYTDSYKDTGDTNSRLDSLVINQRLFNLGSFAGLSQADLKTDKAKIVLRDEADALKLRVTERYFDVLTAQDGVTFAEAEEKALSRQLDQAKLRLEVGLIPITDVLEVQARFDTSVAATIAARNELDSALESLKTVVGPDVNNSLPVMKADAEFLTLDPASMDEWSDLAMQNNAALAQARLNVEIADKQVDIKRSGHFPTLDLKGSFNRYEGAEANQVDNESVAITLTVPLFAGGLTSSESAEASYSYEAAKSALELSRRETMRAVRDAYRGTQAAMSRVKALKAAEESAQSALNSVEQGLTVGTRTIVDVLDAQSNWYKARRDYAQARYDYVINVLSLQRTAGNLSDASIERVNAMLAK